MRTLLAATLVAGVLGLLNAAPHLHAQSVARPRGTAVAVMDMNRVFEHHARFKARMEDLQRDITAYEATVRQAQQRMVSVAEQLKQYKPGTEPYKRTEQELANLQAGLQVDMQLKRKDFMDREARVYYAAYSEVVQTVAHVAGGLGIGLVLRFNGQQMDPTNRESVLQGVNRAVVYERRLNITDQVIERLNRGLPPASIGNSGSQIPVRRSR